MKNTVKALTIVAGIAATLAVFSGVAEADMALRLNYQGRLTDANGVPIADGNYNMVFQIYNAESGGSSVWGPETHVNVPVQDGLFSVNLGSSVTLSGINFNQDCWLETTVAGTTYSPRQRLTGVTYALTVPELSITNAKLANDAVTSAKVLDNTLTAADLAVNVVSSVDGVTNDGGNIDLIAGPGITITPNDGADTITIAANASALDHGDLTGLGDDDHPQYFALAQNETVTGIPAFNGGTSGSSAPFSVDSNFLVTLLNADLLDGYHASAFMTAGTDNWVNVTGDTMTGTLIMNTATAFQLNNTAIMQAKNSGGTYETFFWPRWSDNNMYMNYGSGGNLYIRNNASANKLIVNDTTSQFTTNLRVDGDLYGRSVSGQYSNAYRWGGMYFTWDSASYGTNFEHSLTSTYNGGGQTV